MTFREILIQFHDYRSEKRRIPRKGCKFHVFVVVGRIQSHFDELLGNAFEVGPVKRRANIVDLENNKKD